MKLNKLMDDLDGRSHKKDNIIPTGFVELDRFIGGLRPGQIYTLAARPCMGTTSFAITLVRNIAVFGNTPTAFISMEEGEELIAQRLLKAGVGERVDVQPLKVEMDFPEEIEMLEEVGFRLENNDMLRKAYMQKMKEAPVWIEYAMGMTAEELVVRMETLKREHGVKVVVIDKLGWIVTGAGNMEKQMAMMQLLQAADRLGIAVLMIAGVSRDAEHRIAYRPQISDLRGGYNIESFSSVVMFLYRPEYYCIFEDDCGNTAGMADLLVAKNKYGPLGRVRLDFRSRASFENMSLLPLNENSYGVSIFG